MKYEYAAVIMETLQPTDFFGKVHSRHKTLKAAAESAGKHSESTRGNTAIFIMERPFRVGEAILKRQYKDEKNHCVVTEPEGGRFMDWETVHILSDDTP